MRHGKLRVQEAFTLIELMIVVAIIGILAAIAIPRFADLIRKAGEGQTQGNLGSVRSALEVYYGDLEGSYPDDPHTLTINGKYMAAFPALKTPNYHADSSNIHYGTAGGGDDGAGYWYNNFPNTPNYGHMWVNCTDTDSKGTYWSSY